MTPATFYTLVGRNDVYWRVTSPAKVIGAKTCLIDEEQTNVILAPHEFEPFPWRVRADDLFEYPAHEGAAVWTRPCLVRARHAAAMRELGVRTIAEVDDNYLSDPSLNIFMRVNRYDAQAQQQHLKAMACHDANVFATEWLRDTYAKRFKRDLRYVPELHVCHNNADLADWPEREEGDGRLRIGWMGSPQHARDIKLAFMALDWARDEGHEVILMGNDVRDEEGVTHRRALEACRAWRQVITRHIPWQDPAAYHRSALPFDIGLAPLEMNEHTLGKSDVKAVEYALSGAVPILQNHPVYAKHWRHNETALLANSPVEFLHQLREACRSAQLRKRLVSAAQAYVREERSNERTKREWGEAIDG